MMITIVAYVFLAQTSAQDKLMQMRQKKELWRNFKHCIRDALQHLNSKQLQYRRKKEINYNGFTSCNLQLY